MFIELDAVFVGMRVDNDERVVVDGCVLDSEVTDGVGVLVTNNGITTGSLLQLPER